jgi:two-component system sensor kinase FixL
MSWTTVVWAMGASACLTLAAIQLIVGLRQKALASLLFSVSAVSAAAIAIFELLLMKSPSAEEHGRLLRWVQIPILTMVSSLVLFVGTYLRAGRAWLASTVIGTRVLACVVNFLVHPNLNYSRITDALPMQLLGDRVYVTIGTLSQRSRLGQLSSLFLLAFLVDATRTVWRRGERRKAAVVGGSTGFFILVASTHTALVQQGILRSPFIISVSYLGIVAAMAYELTFDVVQASELSRKLQASEAALRESEQRMSLAADAADVEFWLLDLVQDEVWLSEGARSIRGLGKDERIDTRLFLETIHPDDRGRFRAGVDEALGSGGRFQCEYRVLRPDGEIRWIAAQGHVDQGADGRVRLRGVSADATRRKAAELEIEKSRVSLAHLSRVAMLGELSSSLAHEINQPLTAILANAQAAQRFLARDGEELQEVREILADIVKEDQRAGEVIRRLRLLLKKGEVEFQELELSEVVRDALELVRTDLLNRSVTVSADLPRGLPPAAGDRIQIQQVIVNLVTNACDAMEGKETRDRRIAVRTAADGGDLCVSIEDHGSGISPEQEQRLFEPFFTTKAQGMGLGLSVCRTIVEAHGGKLWATNNPDGGATFHFTLRPSAPPAAQA